MVEEVVPAQCAMNRLIIWNDMLKARAFWWYRTWWLRVYQGKQERKLWFASEGWIHSYPLLRGDEKNKDAFPLSLLANSMDRFWRQLFLCAIMRLRHIQPHSNVRCQRRVLPHCNISPANLDLYYYTKITLLCSLIKKLALFLSVFIRQAEAQAMMLSCLSSKELSCPIGGRIPMKYSIIFACGRRG